MMQGQLGSCAECGARIPPGKSRCTVCGTWVVGGAIGGENSDLKPLTDIPRPSHDRNPTGPWDRAFGPEKPPFGVVQSSVTLLGGARGAGKSTFFLQWCAGLLTPRGFAIITSIDPPPVAYAGGRVPKVPEPVTWETNLQTEPRWVAYLGNEEHANEVAARAERIGIPRETIGRIRAFETLDLSIHLAYLQRLARQSYEDPKALRPAAVLLDSISGLCGDNREAFIYVGRLLKTIAKVSCRCPVLIIDHITKQEQFHGPEALQHDVDTVLGLELNEATGKRYLHPSKNRFGPTGTPAEVVLDMTSVGLVPFTGKLGKKHYFEGVEAPKEPKAEPPAKRGADSPKRPKP